MDTVATLHKKLHSPEIVQTSLRPDIVIQSTATKRLVIVELTVPWEERCQSAYEIEEPSTPTYKLCKELVDAKLGCSCRGWLSGFSSKISVDTIEFPRHTRVVRNNTELQ